jgi:hypothetical protein
MLRAVSGGQGPFAFSSPAVNLKKIHKPVRILQQHR